MLFRGLHKVVSFDGSTTVSEFLVALEKSIGVRESSLSGFALFADDPTVAAVEHCLQASAKVICVGCTSFMFLSLYCLLGVKLHKMQKRPLAIVSPKQ